MKWYHSLYWRIAAGVVACLALLLIVQATLFVWVVARSASTIPNQPPDRLAQTIALDVAQAIDRNPSLEIEKYVRQEYSADTQPFFVLFADHRRIEINGPFPSQLTEEAQNRLDMLNRVPPQRLMRGDRPRRPWVQRLSSSADRRQRRAARRRRGRARTALWFPVASLRPDAVGCRRRDADRRRRAGHGRDLRTGAAASAGGRRRGAPAG